MVLHYPAKIPPRQAEQVDEVVQRAALALGIENGAFHCECMVNERGVYLIEMGARGGGGHIFTRIVEAVSGVGMPLALVKILLGEPVDISPRHTRGACYKFFGPPPGVFEAALDVEQAGRLPGILDFGFHLPPGTAVTPFSNGAERPGYAVAAGATRAEAIANADRAVAAVRFVMRPEGDPSVA